ncbi:MAG: hypothetical protein SCALA702_28160 [Melioribacteraceae bacterium]|nr:MAG: hypothetical protein SCALA702_28160 [Melioribacteraceae bacterium]
MKTLLLLLIILISAAFTYEASENPPDGRIKVVLMGKVDADLNYGGCPEEFVFNIVNKNGKHSENSHDYYKLSSAVSKLIENVGTTKHENDKTLNGFQVIPDKDGYFKKIDYINNLDSKKVKYGQEGIVYRNNCKKNRGGIRFGSGHSFTQRQSISDELVYVYFYLRSKDSSEKIKLNIFAKQDSIINDIKTHFNIK